MEYRLLGKSGLKVSRLSFGTWVTTGSSKQIQEDGLQALLERCLAAGINFFDTAEVYADGEAETILGNVLQRMKLPRSSYVLSTKLFWGGKGVNDIGLSRKHIIEGMKASLTRLQLEYVDVVFCHRPDPLTPLEETCRAMDYLINQGMAFYWGTSEWDASTIEAAIAICKDLKLIAPIVEQPQYNMLHRQRFEKEYLPLFERHGLGTTIWSPLASGLLTGKYNDGIPADSRFGLSTGYSWYTALQSNKDSVVDKCRALTALAAKLDCSCAQLALAWCLLNKNVTTIILGASKVSQLEDNLKALEVVPKLTPEVVQETETILANKPELERLWRTL